MEDMKFVGSWSSTSRRYAGDIMSTALAATQLFYEDAELDLPTDVTVNLVSSGRSGGVAGDCLPGGGVININFNLDERRHRKIDPFTIASKACTLGHEGSHELRAMSIEEVDVFEDFADEGLAAHVGELTSRLVGVSEPDVGFQAAVADSLVENEYLRTVQLLHGHGHSAEDIGDFLFEGGVKKHGLPVGVRWGVWAVGQRLQEGHSLSDLMKAPGAYVMLGGSPESL